MACSAIDGRGINEGMDWLVVSMKELLEGKLFVLMYTSSKRLEKHRDGHTVVCVSELLLQGAEAFSRGQQVRLNLFKTTQDIYFSKGDINPNVSLF